jgi:fructose-specific phosphotransferase system IIC component
MSFILKIPSKTRLIVGIIATTLAVLSFLILDKYNKVGFLGGLISGMLLGMGIGLIVTYKKKRI